jgi:hypothetical protein
MSNHKPLSIVNKKLKKLQKTSISVLDVPLKGIYSAINGEYQPIKYL